MKCAWKELTAILPPKLRGNLSQHQGTLQEIRLRTGAPPELVTVDGNYFLPGNTSSEDIAFIVNAASRYSPWAASTMSKGYITAQGGHRIGICGDVVMDQGIMKGFRTIGYLCIRVARDFEGISMPLGCQHGSSLILGAPGWGKTTLLRDLIRTVSQSRHVSVVDERGELFPPGFSTGIHTDILSNCPKAIGIEMVLRTMGPDYIAVDEITAQEDCEALLDAAHCGVNLLATVHASSVQDLKNRTIYQKLLNGNVFSTYVVMSRDKSWRTERIRL